MYRTGWPLLRLLCSESLEAELSEIDIHVHLLGPLLDDLFLLPIRRWPSRLPAHDRSQHVNWVGDVERNASRRASTKRRTIGTPYCRG
jgi:hypothetical protein